MCRITTASTTSTNTTTTTSSSSSSSSSSTHKVEDCTTNQNATTSTTTTTSSFSWMRLLLALACIPCFPWINRGFTVWFHCMTVLYFILGRPQVLERFQTLSGTAITIGWYGCVIAQWYYEHQWFHVLYYNMPSSMVKLMTNDDDGKLDYFSTTSLLTMALSHVLDLLGHPLLTYWFWRQCRKQHQNTTTTTTTTSVTSTITSTTKTTIQSICTWPIILSAYGYSRLWSMTQSYYNNEGNSASYFYIGYDVYIINELDGWYYAYALETLVFSAAALYRVFGNYDTSTVTTTTTSSTSNYVKLFLQNYWYTKIYPMNPWYVLAIVVPLLPSWCFINRGFTAWFHWVAVLYLVAPCQFLEQFQIICGTSVCLGWYAAVVAEYIQDGKVGDLLYLNMPPYMIRAMTNEEKNGQLDFTTTHSYFTMLLSHFLDIYAHPYMTYYFWYRFQLRMKQQQQHSKGKGKGGGGAVVVSWRDVVTWPVVLASYALVRLYSALQSYHNHGQVAYFYIGHEIYNMEKLYPWYYAHGAEFLVHGGAALWLLLNNNNYQKTNSSRSDNNNNDDDVNVNVNKSVEPDERNHKPTLVAADSCISEASR